MRANKKLIIFSGITTIVAFICSIIFFDFTSCEICKIVSWSGWEYLYDFSMAILTAAFILLISSIIQYNISKRYNLEKIMMKLNSLANDFSKLKYLEIKEDKKIDNKMLEQYVVPYINLYESPSFSLINDDYDICFFNKNKQQEFKTKVIDNIMDIKNELTVLNFYLKISNPHASKEKILEIQDNFFVHKEGIETSSEELDDVRSKPGNVTWSYDSTNKISYTYNLEFEKIFDLITYCGKIAYNDNNYEYYKKDVKGKNK